MNNDLISRRVLKSLIYDKSITIKYEEEKRGNWQYSFGMRLSDIHNVIDNAPTVIPICPYLSDNEVKQPCLQGSCERPKGEWNYIQAGMAVCPFCGASPHKDYKNFCAKCGARLVKGGAE